MNLSEQPYRESIQDRTDKRTLFYKWMWNYLGNTLLQILSLLLYLLYL